MNEVSEKDTNPNIGAAFEITVFDANGDVRQVVADDAKCFVLNFLRMIKNWMINSTYLSFRGDTRVRNSFVNTAGATVSLCGSGWGSGSGSSVGTFFVTAPSATTTHGIVTGRGVTPVAAADYKIEILNAHGTGANQLSYDAVSVLNPTVVDNVLTIPISRMINNSSTGTVDISEIALYLSGEGYIMVLRDLITPTITLNPGEAALIVYKIILNG